MHERKKMRMARFDYSRDAVYFVTSCVQNRLHMFGSVKNNKMILNEFGKIAEKQWFWLQEQYPYIVLHNFVVMSNHIHGLIEINRAKIGENDHIGRVDCRGRSRPAPAINVRTSNVKI